MTTPRATPPPVTEPPGLDGGSAPLVDSTAVLAAPAHVVHHAWDDQEIDTAGTEADPWFPPGDASA